MKIIHFSDPHAGGTAEDIGAYFDKRFVGVFNYRFRRRFRHDLSLLEKAVEYILDIRPDVVVCTGDLTSTGQPGEFEKVRPILTPLRDSGIPFFYMPGNHDCYVPRKKCVEAVKDMVFYLSCGEWNFADFPLLKRVKNCEFLLVNNSRPTNLFCSWGFVARNDLAFVESVVEQKKCGPRIILGHFPLYENHPILRFRHRLYGQKKIVEWIREGKIDLSLCGHVHRPYLILDENGRGENCAGSVTCNGSMTEINVDEYTGNFQFKTIALTEN